MFISADCVGILCETSENAVQFVKLGLVDVLISILSGSFELLHCVLERSGDTGADWFLEIGGMYQLVLLTFDESHSDIISLILLTVSRGVVPAICGVRPPESPIRDVRGADCE